MNEFGQTLITKVSGELVPFDVHRLRKSLMRSRAEPDAIQQVVVAIEAELYEGMSTSEIYKKAFSLLRKSSNSAAARYKLKAAILELGPSGFAFEKFVEAVLKSDGYTTQTNVIVQGCVKHEIDVVAERGNVVCMVECKFHSDKKKYSDVKVSLYIQSRFKDVEEAWKQKPEYEGKRFEGWVVTNTRFSTDAEDYGKCVGLTLLSWDRPVGASLKQRIDEAGLHPITSLNTLTIAEKKAFLAQDVVLSSDLYHHPILLDKEGISKRRKKKILKEAHDLCMLNGNSD
jgi:Holliday junction resolvase-like predicted endonuclease